MATLSTARPASVFRSSAFARFYTGQAFSYLGDGLRTLAIPLLVFRLTGSGTALGWTWGLELLPYAVVSLVAGSLADRVDRRRLMLLCDALRFAVMAALTLLLWFGRLTVAEVYGGVFVLAIGGALFLGAQTPSIPYLVGSERAKGGIAALQATEQSVGLVAPPIGGALLAWVGPLPALAANAVLYVVSQAAIQSVPSYGPDEPQRMPSWRDVVADVVAGCRFAFADTAMRTLTIFSSFANFVASVGFIAIIPYLKRGFGAGDHVVGIAFGLFAGGAALGSVIAGRTHWPLGPAIIVSWALDALLWLPLIWTHSIVVAIGGIAFASVAAGYYVTTVVAWRLRVIPADYTGRVFGAIRFIALVGILPGSVLGGWCADHIGVRPTMAVSVTGLVLLSALLAVSPAVRNERR
ncbi:MAG TPA: MFS transporter [Candidatus Baltobacteraceae bacterium]|nr:MFS transporter [Candidatus Baltobacteraceae bacterium]